MSLLPEQLQYPLRRYGMDHDRYDWSVLPQRKPVVWPNGARVALWIVPALEYICGHDRVWLATGREIARHFLDNNYDAFARAAHPVAEAPV